MAPFITHLHGWTHPWRGLGGGSNPGAADLWLLERLGLVSCVGPSLKARLAPHLSNLAGSVSAASLRQDAAGLSELGRGDVEEGGARNQSQQRQVLLQLVQSGDGDDAVGVEQPVAEQDHQTLLLGNQTLEGLNDRRRYHRSVNTELLYSDCFL